MTIQATSLAKSASPYSQANAVAQRLLRIGINPFQSQNERYIVLLDGSGGEIIEWGKPLRGTRFFEPNAIRKDRPLVADFEEFARRDALRDCVYWGVGLTGAKAAPADLKLALRDFNKRINIEFTELRKSGKFEILLLAIHPRYDEVSGKFDLHAHFVARVPEGYREAAKRRLMVKFSKTDVPDAPIRNAGAVATYMLRGIFRNEVMTSWPDHALLAAWQLTESRFRFVRCGGSFSKWRTSNAPVAENDNSFIDEATRQKNRAETADPRQHVINSDRLLSKIVVKINGVRTAALLFEQASDDPAPSAAPDQYGGREYSSATSTVTQGAAKKDADTITSTVHDHDSVGRRTFRTPWRQFRHCVSLMGGTVWKICQTLRKKLKF